MEDDLSEDMWDEPVNFEIMVKQFRDATHSPDGGRAGFVSAEYKSEKFEYPITLEARPGYITGGELEASFSMHEFALMVLKESRGFQGSNGINTEILIKAVKKAVKQKAVNFFSRRAKSARFFEIHSRGIPSPRVVLTYRRITNIAPIWLIDDLESEFEELIQEAAGNVNVLLNARRWRHERWRVCQGCALKSINDVCPFKFMHKEGRGK